MPLQSAASKTQNEPLLHTSLSCFLLQEMEGYFYNGVIAPALQDRFPDGDWFIVYDAVFASSEIGEEVHSMLNKLCSGHFGVKDLFSL